MAVIEGRTWMEVLSPDVCRDLLRANTIGRLGLVVDGHAEIYPVNYAMADNDVVFRVDHGTKLDAIAQSPSIAMEIDGIDEPAKSGWSVLVVGRAVEVGEPHEMAELRRLPLEPWVHGLKAHWIRLTSLRTTGRRVHKATTPEVQP